MVDQIEMALDDIIKANKKTSRGGGGARRKFNATRKPLGARGGSGAGGGFRNGHVGDVLCSRTRGGISKAANYTKRDMFNDFGERKKQRNAMPSIITGPIKLLVSNLDFGVSDADMQELFSEFGILKSAAVNHDRSGRSLGTAEVVFERKADAIKAVKQYNGELLDGRAMNIQLATSEISTFKNEERSHICSVRNGDSSGPIRRNTNGGGTNRSRGGGGPRDNPYRGVSGGRGEAGDAVRGKRPVLTAEQLDAELDAYIQEIK